MLWNAQKPFHDKIGSDEKNKDECESNDIYHHPVMVIVLALAFQFHGRLAWKQEDLSLLRHRIVVRPRLTYSNLVL